MRKWKVPLLGAAAVALGLVLVRLLAPAGEGPVYEGRHLSHWVEVYGSWDYPPAAQVTASNAVSHAGVQALPWLLKWIQYEPPRNAEWLLHKTPRALSPLLIPIAFPPRGRLAEGCIWAFGQLGTNAAPALPALAGFLQTTNPGQTTWRTMRALDALGTNGLPYVVALALKTNDPASVTAICALAAENLTPEASKVVTPVLLSFLETHPQHPVSHQVMYALGNNPHAPDVTVPALSSHLTNPATHRDLRYMAARALAFHATNSAAALPALTNALADPDAWVRAEVTNSIREITRQLRDNLPPK
jgi:hypothetical protein